MSSNVRYRFDRNKNYFKSPNILVIKEPISGGLKLIHQDTHVVYKLTPDLVSQFWEPWSSDALISCVSNGIRNELYKNNFISFGENIEIPISSIDNCIPIIVKPYTKWYAETSDFYVLFNTANMSIINPLIILGPYGSLCWSCILKGYTVGRIRVELIKVFGCDEVIIFLNRLITLGYILPIDNINQIKFRSEKIIKEFFAPNIQFQLIHTAIPWYCLWEINTNCDLRCKTCYLPNFDNIGLLTFDALSITNKIIESGVFYVGIMGGEPLLRDDLICIIDTLRLAGVFVKVISNGQSLTLHRAHDLALAGVNQVEISFDGLSEQTHEFSRGKETFNKAIKAINNIRKAGIKRNGMVLTIYSENVDEIELLPKFMYEHGIFECYISLFKKTGRSGSTSTFNPIEINELHFIYRRLDEWRKTYPELTIAISKKCSCGRSSVIIGYNAELRPCSFLYESMGNLLENSFCDIWQSIEDIIPEVGAFGYCSFNKII